MYLARETTDHLRISVPRTPRPALREVAMVLLVLCKSTGLEGGLTPPFLPVLM